MKIYQSKIGKIPGRNYSDIERAARKIHNDIARTTKRSTYIKSELFCVQVKQNSKGSKYFMSVFSPK